jgi:DNA-binding NtrC family response regulator
MSTLGKYHVLLVDDERPALETASAILSEEFEVVSCQTPREALQHLADGSFHVVCTDFQMPEMNGAELLRQAFERWAHLYGVILTGQTETPRRTLGEDGRRVGLLFKPYDPERLLQLVAQFAKLSEMKRRLERLGAPAVKKAL